MESPLSQRGHAHFESVSVWTTSGSNITLGPCDKLVQAFAELQTIHTENMNCDSSICTDKLLMPAFEESKSAILETEIKILNHFSRFYFVWRKDHDPVAATKICPHEPCFLSIYNSNIQSEGKYSLWLCKRSIDEVQDDESVMLFSATVKIGGEVFSIYCLSKGLIAFFVQNPHFLRRSQYIRLLALAPVYTCISNLKDAPRHHYNGLKMGFCFRARISPSCTSIVLINPMKGRILAN